MTSMNNLAERVSVEYHLLLCVCVCVCVCARACVRACLHVFCVSHVKLPFRMAVNNKTVCERFMFCIAMFSFLRNSIKGKPH